MVSIFAAALSLGSLPLFLGYVTNNSFPRPLSEEEEKKHIRQMLRGDESARNILIEHNLRLVAHIVKKYEGAGYDTEDLISIGSVGLVKAIKTYNPNKGTRLATYAARCIENEILMYFRSAKKSRTEISLHEPVGVDKEGNEVVLIDILGSEPDAVVEQVSRRIEQGSLREKLSHLTCREQKIITARYGLLNGKCLTQHQIADILGISRSYVSRIEKRALEKLGVACKNQGVGG
ncbi:MAG: RNA polymerase sporulation sigma factor SigK [Ammonifex sp.]|jgi:RNA polymerase sporulation-specific sigma factor|nr:MAG: RNA polymerase sporulation sigma factor SigK [Ammonifex sp.]